MAVVPRLDLQVAAIPGAASVQGADTQMPWLEQRSSAIGELPSKAVLCMDSPGARKRPRACEKKQQANTPSKLLHKASHAPANLLQHDSTLDMATDTHTEAQNRSTLHTRTLAAQLPQLTTHEPPAHIRRMAVMGPHCGHASTPHNAPLSSSTHTPTQPIAASAATRNTLDWEWGHKTVKRNMQPVEVRPSA